MQDDARSTTLTGRLLEGVAARAIAGPAEVLLALAPRVRVHLHLIRHHERAVEAHTELADELRVLLLPGVLERLHKRL
jgi:hypothetical protein